MRVLLLSRLLVAAAMTQTGAYDATVAADGTVRVSRVEDPVSVMRSASSPPAYDDPIVMMYDAVGMPPNGRSLEHPSEGVVHLLQQLHAVQWPYLLVGSGTTWRGWSTKVQSFVEELKKMDAGQLVVVADSRDVLLNPSPGGQQAFSQKFKEFEAKHPKSIFVQAEGQCCVSAMNEVKAPGHLIDRKGKRIGRAFSAPNHQVEEQNVAWQVMFEMVAQSRGFELHAFPALGAGLLVGRASNLLKMYEYLNPLPEEDDQVLMSEALFMKKDMLILDYNQEFFGSNRWVATRDETGRDVYHDEGCLYEWNATAAEAGPDGVKNSYYRNRHTGRVPHFIHTGGTFWECIRKIDFPQHDEKKASMAEVTQVRHGIDQNCDAYNTESWSQCHCNPFLWWTWDQCRVEKDKHEPM